MDELKLVLDIIKSLPEMAIWALIILYFYKITIVGSIYGVIRYVTGKWYDWAIAKKSEVLLPPKIQQIHFAEIFHGVTILGDDTLAQLVRQIQRLQKEKGNDELIDRKAINWLRDAIDIKLDIDKSQSQELNKVA
jgi:hypothetical protein